MEKIAQRPLKYGFTAIKKNLEHYINIKHKVFAEIRYKCESKMKKAFQKWVNLIRFEYLV